MTTKKLWRSFQNLSRQPLYWLMAALRRRRVVSVDTLKRAPPRSILLIRLDGLGDVVLSLGTINAFHALYPQAEISVLIYKHSAPLLEHLPGVKRVFVLEKEHWGRVLQLVWQLWRNRCEWSVHLTHTTGWTPGFFATLGGKIPISFHKPHGDIFFDVMIPAPEAHTFQKQETLVRALGYDGPFDLPSLPLTEDDTKIVSLLPPREAQATQRCCRVGLFLGNGRHPIRRRWSLEKYAALARRLVHTLECQIIVLWGPDERALAVEFQNMTKELTPQPWCHPPTTVREMAALLEGVDVLVATTTGPLHLAEAMGTPVVALCRQQAYQGWRPLAAYHRIVQAPGENIDVIEVETVFERVKEILGCRGTATRLYEKQKSETRRQDSPQPRRTEEPGEDGSNRAMSSTPGDAIRSESSECRHTV